MSTPEPPYTVAMNTKAWVGQAADLLAARERVQDFPGGLWERLWSKVSFPRGKNGCWEWAAWKTAGYGGMRAGLRNARANRIAWAFFNAPVADGLVLDHLCRNPPCVNPDHLEPVTDRVNILRGVGPTAKNATKTHCPRGHEYTPENTIIWRSRAGDARRCKICRRQQESARPHRVRDRRRVAAGGGA